MFRRARNTGYQWARVCKKLSKNAKCTRRCDMKKTTCRIRDDLRHSWSSYSRRWYDFPRLRRRKIKPRIRVSVRPSVRVSHVAACMQWNAVISRLSRARKRDDRAARRRIKHSTSDIGKRRISVAHSLGKPGFRIQIWKNESVSRNVDRIVLGATPWNQLSIIRGSARLKSLYT